ncbi:phage tail tape measure protein [Microbacterium gilvum]|uniref:Phage tail tape measure protein domain-containing protein n=1 Tax=Microbacterium gilvum TaxID=1336204 RepID=A0ABP8ZRG0_9MICO
MSERVVRVRLSAQVAEYEAGMKRAAQATRETGTEAEKLAQKRQAFETVGRYALGMGTTMAAGMAIAIAKYAEFDQAMSYVQAATHETADSMNALREAALDAGARTVFSATEAANAIEELAKAGVSTKDILGGGLNGALDLAAAGGLGVADAAGIAATAIQTFNLQGSDMSHVADLLAAGAGKAMGDVTDMAQALNQAGLVANQTGLSIEETTAGLAAFAQQGLLGSDAGTSFKSMLQSLNPSSREAAELMDRYNLSAYDAQGNFVGLAEYAGKLKAGLSDLSVEQQNATLKTIFGSDAVRAASVLYSEGAEGIQEWTAAVDDQGFAAETAAMRLDNLKGDWEGFTGALDTALISMGEGADGPLRFLTQSATELVDKFNELPAWAQQAIGLIGGVGAAAATAAGLFLTGAPKIVEYKLAIEELGPVAQRTSRIVGAAMKGLGVAAIVIASATALDTLQDSLAGTEATTVELANALKTAGIEETLRTLTQGISGNGMDTGESIFSKVTEEASALGDMLDNLATTWDTRGFVLSQFYDWVDGNVEPTDALRDALDNLGEALSSMPLDDAVGSLAKLREAYDLTDEQMSVIIENSGPFRDQLIAIADELGIEGDAATLLSIAMGEIKPASDEASEGMEAVNAAAEAGEEQLQAYKDALDAIAASALEMGDAKDAAQSALNALTEAAKAEGVTLDGTNDASIKLRDSLREVETSHRDAAEAMIANGEGADAATDAYLRSREAVLDTIQPYFESREAAAQWADENLGAAEDVVYGLGLIQDATGEVITRFDQVPAVVETRLEDGQTITDTDRRALELISTLASVPGHTTTIVDDPTTAAVIQRMKDLGFNVEHLPDGTVTVTSSGVDQVQAAINSIDYDRQVYIDVMYRFNDPVTPPGSFGGSIGYQGANGMLPGFMEGQAFANGGLPMKGLPTGVYAGRPQAIYKFAEQETRWEAFISGKRGQEQRNREITKEAAFRLGGTAYFPEDARAFADGGILNTQKAYDRAVQHEYDQWRQWMTSQGQADAHPDADWMQERADGWKKRWQDAEQERKSLEQELASAKDRLVSEQTDWYESLRWGDPQQAGISGGGRGLVNQLRDAAADTGGRTGAEMNRRADASEEVFRRLEAAAEKADDALAAAQDRAQERERAAQEKSDKLLDTAQERADTRAKKAQAKSDKLLDDAEDRAEKRTKGAQARSDKLLDEAEARAEKRSKAAQAKADALLDAAEKRQKSRNEKAEKSAAAVIEKATAAASKSVQKVTDKWAARLDVITGKLDELRSASQQMASSISNAVRGFYNLGAMGQATSTTKTVTERATQTVGGFTLNTAQTREVTTETPVTSKSIKGQFAKAAAGIKAFSSKLSRLAKKGIAPALLAEIASLGVENGTPIVDALLTATAGEIKAINSSYAQIGKFSDAAGETAADANYKAIIAATEKQLRAAEKASKAEISAAEKRARQAIQAANQRAKEIRQEAAKIGRQEVAEAKAQGKALRDQASRINREQIAEAKTQGKAIRDAAAKKSKEEIDAAKAQGRAIRDAAARKSKDEVDEAKAQGKALREAAKKRSEEEIAAAKKDREAITAKLREETNRVIEAISKGLGNPWGAEAQKRAGGGRVLGPGGPKDDKVAAWLSNDEHVLETEVVRAMGGHDAVDEWRAAMRSGQVARLANGGRATRTLVPTAREYRGVGRAEPGATYIDRSTTTVALVARPDESATSQARRAVRVIDAKNRKKGTRR